LINVRKYKPRYQINVSDWNDDSEEEEEEQDRDVDSCTPLSGHSFFLANAIPFFETGVGIEGRDSPKRYVLAVSPELQGSVQLLPRVTVVREPENNSGGHQFRS
jgi:hypothetical protein